MTAEQIAAALEGGRRSGSGWVARCPAHDDVRPSLSVDDSADGRVLIKCHAGCEQDAVIEALRSRGLWGRDDGDRRKPRPRLVQRTDPGRCLQPIPADAPAPPGEHPQLGRPSARWPYRSADRRILGFLYRFDDETGKSIRPLTFWAGGEHGDRWEWRTWPVPRPLCGLDRLARRPDAPVLVTEGEKACEAAHRMLPEFVCVTSPGGSKAADKADWGSLRGRRVTVWPDFDKPGWQYAQDVARLALEAGAESVKMVVIECPDEVPRSWDLGDPLPGEWTVETIRQLLQDAEPVEAPTVAVETSGPAPAPEVVDAVPVDVPAPVGARVRPAAEVYAGVIGELVDMYHGCTEADPLAIAAQLIVGFGSAVGRTPYVQVGETVHRINEALVLTGRSSRARKGDSCAVALRALKDADPGWRGCIASGLSSGEGLIFAVRDPVYKVDKKGNRVLADAGADDKRLLIVETEFSHALKNFSREGNVLSSVLRDAWDGRACLRTLTKASPTTATDAHVSLIAHTTPDDLHRYLSSTETANGLANRLMFVEVERACLLPDPGRVDPERLAALSERVAAALDRARRVGELVRTPAAAELWRGVYAALSSDAPGLLGPLLARAEAHVLRLSLIYALLDGATAIDVQHLESALAFWDVVDASTRRIFSGRTGDKVADRIRAGLMPGAATTLDTIRRDVLYGHVTAAELTRALTLLRDLEAITIGRQMTNGRSAIMVTLTTSDDAVSGGAGAPKAAMSAA